MTHTIFVRGAEPRDIAELLGLMRGLAQFEGYIDRFAVDADTLLARGFSDTEPPQFHVSVAVTAEAGTPSALVGYALTYLIPFTFDLRPTLVLKEFFVVEAFRGSGVGRKLFDAVLVQGRARGARLLRWQVLPGNEAAARFYRTFGGRVDAGWDNWVLELSS